MASPFRLFRKHQKTMLAVAGVICMFVFVVGDSLFSYFGGSRNARATNDREAGAVAVSWDGGKLTNRQLNDLVARRKMVNYFLREVEANGRRPSVEAGVDAPELRVESLLGPESPQDHVEEHVVKIKLFADAARKAGMKVSDDTVVQYLMDWGRGNVSSQDMRKMLKGRTGVTIDYVIDAIREEMLARNYLRSHEYAFDTVTPQQRWKDWLQVKDFVILEAAAVPAESFLVDVKDPSEAELTSFFDKYKDHEAAPEFYGPTELPSATPGFKIPRKIDVQFVQANYEELLAKAEPKITEQEIAKYYDEHKDQFEKAQLGLSEDKGAKKDGTKPTPPAAEKPSQSDTKKAAEPESKKGDTPAGSEKKATEPPANKDDKKHSKSDDAKKSSSLHRAAKSVFRLTAFEQKEEDKDSKDDKAAPAAESADSDGKAESKSDENAKSATPPPAPASSGAAPAAQPAGAPAAGPKPPGPALKSPGASAPKKPV